MLCFTEGLFVLHTKDLMRKSPVRLPNRVRRKVPGTKPNERHSKQEQEISDKLTEDSQRESIYLLNLIA